MDNNTFRRYIAKKLSDCRADLRRSDLPEAERAAAEKALKWLESADRICRFSCGDAVRRFRRNYERSLRKQGMRFLTKYEIEGRALRGTALTS